MLRRMAPNDFEELVLMGHEFIEESGLNVEPDEDQMRESLNTIYHTPGIYCYIWWDVPGECIAGFFIAVRDRTFYKKPWLMMQEFFVRPAYRGGHRVANDLVGMYLKIAEIDQCSHVFAASTAQISPEINERFVGLFKKHGFAILGPTLVKDLTQLKENENG